MAGKMNSHDHLHSNSAEDRDEEAAYEFVSDLGVVEETCDTARMKCATTRCGLESAGSLAAGAVERDNSSRKLSRAVIICLVFMAVEVAGGVYANSLAILTDAAHLLTDVAGFAISLFAIWASGWEATPLQTFGFARLEILGALGSILLIWLLTGILVYEALQRLVHVTQPVDGRLMFFIATLGLLVNLAMMFLLGHDHGHAHGHGHGHRHGHSHSDSNSEIHNPEDDHSKHGHDDRDHTHGSGHAHSGEDTSGAHDHHDHEDNHNHGNDQVDSGHRGHSHDHGGYGLKEPFIKTQSITLTRDISKRKPARNINVQGAYLHVLGDLLQSVGVMIGAAAIWYNPDWKVIDIICTLLFSLLVLVTTIKMIRDILEVLMESTPREIDARAVHSGLLELPEVVEVHDLHIWALTVGKTLLACHVRVEPQANTDDALQVVTDFCEKRFKISHVTIQIERDL